MSDAGNTPTAGGSKDTAKVQFLAFTGDPESAATLKQFSAKLGQGDSAVHDGDIETAITFLKSNPSPRVLCIDIASAEAAPGALDRLADVCDPSIKVIVSGKINEYSFYTWLVEVGIHHYLLKPFTLASIETAYKKAIEEPGTAAALGNAPLAEAKKEGKIIAVLGTRGGVGATTVAANIAWILANQFKQKTAMLDLDPQLGTVALALDLEPGRGLREALEKPDRIDSLFMDRVMVKVDEFLSILSTEESLEENIVVSAASAEALFKQTRPKFTHIVVDVPRVLSPYTRYALSHADHIVCVTEYTLVGLRESLRYLEFCRDTLKVGTPMFVVNRSGMAGKHQMPQAEFDGGLGQKPAFSIPFILDAYAAATAGKLLVETSKNTTASKVMNALAAHFVEGAQVEEAPAKKGMLGLIKGKK